MPKYQFIQSIVDSINDGVCYALNEELAISTEVEQTAQLVKNKLLTDFHTKSTCKEGKLTYRSGNFVCNLFGNNYTVNYIVYTCDIQLCISELRASYVDNNKSILHLHLALIDGQPYKTHFDNIIEHELLHVFQYNKSKKDVLSSVKTRNMYNIVMHIFNTCNDDLLLTFANALYASFDFEQDAMTHALYAQLMNSPLGINYKYVLNHSDEYQYLYDMKYILEHKQDIDFQKFNVDLKRYKLSEKSVFAYIEQGLKRFETKLGKMLSKYLKDYEFPSGCSIPQISHH